MSGSVGFDIVLRRVLGGLAAVLGVVLLGVEEVQRPRGRAVRPDQTGDRGVGHRHRAADVEDLRLVQVLADVTDQQNHRVVGHHEDPSIRLRTLQVGQPRPQTQNEVHQDSPPGGR